MMIAVCLIALVVDMSRLASACSPAAKPACTATPAEIDNCKNIISKCGGMSRSYFRSNRYVEKPTATDKPDPIEETSTV